VSGKKRKKKGTQLISLEGIRRSGYRIGMPRAARYAPGGYVYHVLNRAVARLPLFAKDGDYAAFERVLAEAMDRHPTRLLAWCLMPNHWHLVLWPAADGQLTPLVRWLTHTHAMRWHTHYHSAGTGHLYQGRFKAFPIDEGGHLFAVLRYVERNALRAGLVRRAEHWRWGSLWQRCFGPPGSGALVHPGPEALPADWLERVNAVQTEAELEALRRSVVRGCPYGSEAWQARVAGQLGLGHTLRPRGRPKKGGGQTADLSKQK
jgi:putative transposase